MHKELTSLQNSIIMTQKLQPSNAAYNLPYFWKLSGDSLNIELLSSSLEKTFNSHEVYHSYLKHNKLHLDSNSHFLPEIVELTYDDKNEFEEKVFETVTKLANIPFDNEVWPLQYAKIFVNTLDNSECYLFINISHLICDVYTAYELINEINFHYNHPTEDYKLKTGTSHIKKRNLKREVRARDYFYSKFQEIDGLEQNGLSLKSDLTRKNLDVRISNEKVKQLSKLTNKSDFEILLLCYGILLSKVTSQNRIVIGIPLANRQAVDRHSHGCFVNNLPLVIDLSKSKTVKELLEDISRNLHNLMRFQSFDINSNLKYLSNGKEANMGFMNNSVTFYKDEINFEFSNVVSQNIIVEQKSSMFALAVEFEMRKDDFIVHIQTSGQYSPEFLTKAFKNILDNISILTEEYEKVPLLDSQTSRELFEMENDKIVNYQEKNIPVLRLFEEQCNYHPDVVAVKYLDKKMTYRELERLSNSLAAKLRLIDQEYVTVSVAPSPYLIVALLAIFKSGKVYIPLDKDMPDKRKKLILNQLNNFIVITDYSSEIFDGLQTLNLEDLMKEIDSDNNLEISQQQELSNEIAYIIFTSGSTGVPKGVEIRHNSLESLMAVVRGSIDNAVGKNWILFHSYGFDYSIFEILSPLVTGGTLNIVPTEIRRYPDEFRQFIRDNNINVLTQTPSSFLSLERVDSTSGDFLSSLEYIFIGGEDIKFSDLSNWFEKYGYNQPKVYNLYGLTETTIISTAHLINEEDVEYKKRNNIGKAIANTIINVKNSKGEPVLPGFEGELIISGIAVAKDYYNNPQKTEEVFFNESFKTGDLVRVLSNGELEYISRIDKQVQVSGHRVELGEIENKICECQYCVEACVVAKDFGTGDRRLIAYYKLSEPDKMSSTEIRKDISAKLPDYMLPSFFVEVDSFPLNTNGKIDASKLPQVEYHYEKENFQDNGSTTLEKVVNIWSKVLGRSITEEDNFFEVGGTSVLITEVYYQILQAFGLSEDELTMIDLFDYVSPIEVASFIDEKLQEEGE
nr:amino acid adenylation domain-containing protein [Streptococcus lutetiensis]